MRKIKIWITILIVLISIITLSLLIILNRNSVNDTEPSKEFESYIKGLENPALVLNGVTAKKVSNENIFYTIENCINKYIEYNKNRQIDSLYGILNLEYINKRNITKENILTLLNSIEKSSNLDITEMYELVGAQYGYYYISCNIGNIEYFFNINIDTSTRAFDIQLYDMEIYKKSITEPMQVQDGKEKHIELNKYNEVIYSKFSQEEIIKKYVKDFTTTVKNDINLAYDMLDIEYREKKFGSIEKFNTYIKNNINKIENGSLTNYGSDVTDNATEYYYVDTNGYYFTIKKNNIKDYKIILDNYTIKTDLYVQEYNKLRDEEKVNNNISIFLKMLDEKEYKSAYNLLDVTFRQNNFNTEEKFEKYAKQNFMDHNIGNIIEMKKQNDLFICTYKIKSGVGVSAKTITKNFVMQLKEGTDFVMSFEV